MSPQKQNPTPKELEKSRDARIAVARKAQQENYVNLLRLAKRLVGDSNATAIGVLDQLIASGVQDLNRLDQLCRNTWIVERKRPQNKQSGETCCIYLDECGAHELRSAEPYRAFVLSAVIIRDTDHDTVDQSWKAFKAQNLGSTDVNVHEPEVRRGNGPFDNPHRARKRREMRATFASLSVAIITVVVHRDDYIHDFGLGPVDTSLPAHIYWMALDFLMERAVMALDLQFKGATARVVAEARGPLEDAQLQYEFARLHLDGTSYIRPGWFRQALLPGIRFENKDKNITGLQLADLVARPVGDKILNPRRKPYLWDEIKPKLCPDQETLNSILGLKVMPWRPRYKDIWK